MSAKMRRRRRHERRKRILIERRETALFFSRGTIPASSHAFATCGCGAAAFTFDRNDTLEDFWGAHMYCADPFDDEVAS